MEESLRRRLFNNLKSDGYELGTYEQFDSAMNDPEKRKKLYDNLSSDGYELGDYKTFQSNIGGVTVQQNSGTHPENAVEHKKVNSVSNPVRKQANTRHGNNTQNSSEEDTGFWGNVWGGIKNVVSGAVSASGENSAAQTFKGLQQQQENGVRTFSQRAETVKKEREELSKKVDENRPKLMARQQQLEQRRKAVEDAYQKAKKEAEATRDADNSKALQMFNGNGGMATPGNLYPLLSVGADVENARMSAIKEIEDEEKLIGTLLEGGGNATMLGDVMRGIRDAATSADTYTSIPELRKSSAVKKAMRKYESGEDLNPAESELLRTVAEHNDVEGQENELVSSGYNMGQIAMQSVPFMAEFMLTPTEGIANAVGRGVTNGLSKVAAKSLGKEFVEQASKIVVKATGEEAGLFTKVAANAIKSPGAIAGDLASATVLSSTYGASGIMADMVERTTGRVMFKRDPNGDIIYNEDGTPEITTSHYVYNADGELMYDENGRAVKEDTAESTASAFAKAFGANVIENYTEMLGRHINLLPKGIRENKYVKGFSDFAAKAGMNELPGEVIEEEAGMVLNTMFGISNDVPLSALMKDRSERTQEEQGAIDSFIPNQLEMIGGLALSMGAMAGAYGTAKAASKTAGYGIDGVSTLYGYYGSKRKMDNAAKFAEYMTDDSKFDFADFKSRAENAKNEEIPAMYDGVMSEEGLNDIQKAAIGEYLSAQQMFRGFNIGTMSRSSSKEEQMETEATMAGHEASPEERTDIQARYDLASQKFRDTFMGVGSEADIEAWLESKYPDADGTSSGYMMAMQLSDPEVTEETRKAATDYFNARSAINGVHMRMSEDVEDRVGEMELWADKNSYTEGSDEIGSKSLIPATLNDGTEVYVVRSEGLEFENGQLSGVTGYTIVRDQKTGELKQVDSSEISNYGEVIDSQEFKKNRADEIRSAMEAEHAQQLSGEPAFAPGDVYYGVDESGNAYTASIIEQTYGDATIPFVSFNGMQPVELLDFMRENISQDVQRARVQKISEEDSRIEEGQVRDNAESQLPVDAVAEAPAEEIPVMEQGSQVFALDGNGNEVTGEITKVNDDGTYDVDWENPVEGMRSQRYDDAQLQKMMSDVAAKRNEESVTEESVAEEPVAEEPAAEEPVSEEPVAEEPSEEPMPFDKSGNPDFRTAGAERTNKFLDEESMFDNDQERQEFIDANLAKAQKDVEKHDAKKPKMSSDYSKLQRDRAEWKQKKEELDANLAFWEDVNSQRAEYQKKRAEEAKAVETNAELAPVDNNDDSNVPDWVTDNSAEARQRGYRMVNGERVDRSKINIDNAVLGGETTVKFGNSDNDVKETGYLVLPSSSVKASHVNGSRNPFFFITEAQPKERTDAASQSSAEKIAKDINPQEITEGTTAYVGAPVTNVYGEVVQGNNRTSALQKMYEEYPDSARKYVDYLKENADKFGLDANAVEKMYREGQNPVLVRVIEADDNESIRLGQMTAANTESGGKERIDSGRVTSSLDADQYAQYQRIILNSIDEDTKLADRIESNGRRAAEALLRNGAITETQFQSLFDKSGKLTDDGKSDLRAIVEDGFFRGGNDNLRTMFEELPESAKQGILMSYTRDSKSNDGDRIVPEVQSAVEAYYDALKNDSNFANARSYEDAKEAIETWKNQSVFDFNGESYFPSNKFSNFALELAARLRATEKMTDDTDARRKTTRANEIVDMFNAIYDMVQGEDSSGMADMFGDGEEAKSAVEAIKSYFNIDYNGTKLRRSNAVAGNNEEGAAGGQDASGVLGQGKRDETPQGGTDGTGGTEGDSKVGKGKVGVSGAPSYMDGPNPEGIGRGRKRIFENAFEAYNSTVVNSNPLILGREGPAYTYEDFVKNYSDANGEYTTQKDGRFLREFYDYFEALYNKKVAEEQKKRKDAKKIEQDDDVYVLTDPVYGQVTRREYKDTKEKGIAEKNGKIDSGILFSGKYLQYAYLLGDDAEIKEAENNFVDSLNRFKGKSGAKDIEYFLNSYRVNEDPTDDYNKFRKSALENRLSELKSSGNKTSKSRKKKARETVGMAREAGLDLFEAADAVSGVVSGGNNEIDPVGNGYFGNVYDAFKGKAKEAFDYLSSKMSGDMLSVFTRKDIGDIDVVWGDGKAGLSHILSKHVGEGKSFSNLDDAVSNIERIINEGYISFENGDKALVRLGGKVVTIRKNLRINGKKIADKNWILTAYDELSADGGNSAISTTIEGKAALTTDNSAGKVTYKNNSGKEKGAISEEISGNTDTKRLVSDDRMEELKKKLKAKMRGQLNMGIDPETLAIGLELAVGHIERGLTKFSSYAKQMVDDFGDAIKPYLKAFYNGARDMPEAVQSGLDKQMDSYDTVSKFDLDNIGIDDEAATVDKIGNEISSSVESKKVIADGIYQTYKLPNDYKIKWKEVETFSDDGYTYKRVQASEYNGDLIIRISGTNKKNPVKEFFYVVSDWNGRSFNDVILSFVEADANTRHLEDAVRQFYHDKGKSLNGNGLLRPAFVEEDNGTLSDYELRKFIDSIEIGDKFDNGNGLTGEVSKKTDTGVFYVKFVKKSEDNSQDGNFSKLLNAQQLYTYLSENGLKKEGAKDNARDPRYVEGWDGDYDTWKKRRDYLDELERKDKKAVEEGRKEYFVPGADSYGQRNGTFHKVWLLPSEVEEGNVFAGKNLWTREEAFRSEEGFQLGNIFYNGDEVKNALGYKNEGKSKKNEQKTSPKEGKAVTSQAKEEPSLFDEPVNAEDTEKPADDKQEEKLNASLTYSVTPSTYTNKRGITSDVYLVKFDGPLTSDQLKKARELAKDDKGWYDRKEGGFMMRSPEKADAMANEVLSTISNNINEDYNEQVQGLHGSSSSRGQERQPADENGTLGEGEQHETQRPQRKRLDGGNAEHSSADRLRAERNRRLLSNSRPRLEGQNKRNNRAERGVDYAPKSPSARYKANIAAIKLSKKLQESGAVATAEQMEVLRKFSGWGGLGTFLNNAESSAELRALIGDEGFESAAMSANSAYFTPAYVVDTLWDVAQKLGFEGGNILEGSAGIGNILGLMPQSISDRSHIEAVEIEGVSGNILSQLYPDANVHIQGFQDTKIPNGSVDLAITNVPFVTGLMVIDRTGDKDLSKRFRNIHDFCIAKNVRKLREGGVGIFITTSGTLDKSQDLVGWITKEGKSDVVGAFRLNNETFGGTNATSDIIIVRKRVGGMQSPNAIDVSAVSVERTTEYETGNYITRKGNRIPEVKNLSLSYNAYFANHPENMGGKMDFNFEHGDTFRPTGTGLYPSGANQQEMLSVWVDSFANLQKEAEGETVLTEIDKVSKINERLGDGVKEGSMLLNSDGEICIARLGEAVPLETNGKKVKGHTRKECFKAYSDVKTSLQDVLDYQKENVSDDELGQLLKRLNSAYDKFVAVYGYFTKNPAIAFLRNDVDYSAIMALEKYEETGDKKGNRKVKVTKNDVFRKRVVNNVAEPQPKNISDAVTASIFKYGNIDVDYIAGIFGISFDEAKEKILGDGHAFEDPSDGSVVVDYEYLCGNVREKLKAAKENDAEYPGKFKKNIEALENVLPMFVPGHLIEFNIGSSWVDPKLFEEYVLDRTGIHVKAIGANGTWELNNNGNVFSEKNKSFGVSSKMFKKTIFGTALIEAAMSNKTITVSESHKDYLTGKTVTETDKEATQACLNRISEIRDDFKTWAKKYMQENPEFADKTAETYNDRFNNYVPKTIPKSYQREHLDGSNTEIKLYPHQSSAVVRAMTEPVLLAHEVGTGKTFTQISIAMEMRRLGTARKPMIVVQNATVGQFVASAKLLYPGSKVLTIEDTDRTTEGRKNFYAKIRYNDWDMIVVPQSVFERIPDSEERQLRYIQDKINEKMAILEQMKQEGNEGSMIVRQAERELEALQTDMLEISGLAANKKKQKDEKRAAKARENAAVRAEEMLDREVDDVENFDDMGIDAIIVDEAHEYKHLGFATAMQRGVKGVDPSYSKKSQGVYLKCQAVLEKNGGKNVIFATGTPISNTAAEIWTFMKYLMPAERMKDYGIYYFDDFVRNFGNIATMLEFSTSGQFKEQNRFSGYVNLPELNRIWSGVADTVLTEEAGKVKEKIPAIDGQKPTDVYLPQSKSLRSIMAAVKARLKEFDEMDGKQKKENSHIPLVCYGIAAKAAIDPRLVSDNAPDEPGSKTNKAVEEILSDLKSTKSYKGTCAVFCDSYQNKNSGFNLYEDIAKKLIANGVPAEQIFIMKSGMTVKKKAEVFDKVNRGEIRVIMGSTQTLGTGVNIQERLHLLIHMDVPNRPMDYTQRNGRILRQGNLHKEWNLPVRILRFGVEDSLDVTGYQRLKTKGAIADSIMKGKKYIANNQEDRTIEEEEDQFGDVVANLSGSQFAMAKNAEERKLRKLESQKSQHEADQIYVSNAIRRYTSRNQRLEEEISGLKSSLEKIESDYNGKSPSITVNGKTFKSVSGMDDFFKEYNKKQKERENYLREQAAYRAAPTSESTLEVQIGPNTFVFHSVLSAKTDFTGGKVSYRVERKLTYSNSDLGIEDKAVDMGYLKNGITDIIDNVVSGNNARSSIAEKERSVSRNISELEVLKEREGKPFQFEDKLAESRKLVDELTEKMRKELEEKEAKYAEMDSEAGVADIDISSENSNTEDEDETRFRDDDAYEFLDPNDKTSLTRDEADELRNEFAEYSTNELSDIIAESVDTENYGRAARASTEIARRIFEGETTCEEGCIGPLQGKNAFYASSLEATYSGRARGASEERSGVIRDMAVKGAGTSKKEEGSRSLERAKAIAGEQGCWFGEGYLDSIADLDNRIGSGSEAAEIYMGKDGTLAEGKSVMVVPVYNDANLWSYLVSSTARNEIPGIDRTSLVGLGEFNGKLAAIFTRDYVPGVTVDDYMEERGVDPDSEEARLFRENIVRDILERASAEDGVPMMSETKDIDGNLAFETDDYIVSDFTGGNIIIDGNGVKHIIDCTVSMKQDVKPSPVNYVDTTSTRYRLADENEARELEKKETIRLFRAMQLVELEDGTKMLVPPMAGKIEGKWQTGIRLDSDGKIIPGQWEISDERPELAKYNVVGNVSRSKLVDQNDPDIEVDENGQYWYKGKKLSMDKETGKPALYFWLDKGNGKGVPARYNPYWHTSPSPLNDQFAQAQDRPNIVTVEVEVPVSEIYGDNLYKAKGAKDSTGNIPWPAGPVTQQLQDTRFVTLTRYDKPVRIVNNDEVARTIVKIFGETGITMPTNVVTPSLREELEKLGVPFIPTNNSGVIQEGPNKGKYYRSVYKREAAKLREADKVLSSVGTQNYRKGGRKTAEDLIVKLGLNDVVELHDSENQYNNESDKLNNKKRRSKGWYSNGKIHVNLHNHNDSDDIAATIFHEAVAHYGLRKMVGSKNFNNFIMNIYANVSDGVRREIDNLADKKYNGNHLVATEEYLANLAEKMASESNTLPQKIYEKFKEVMELVAKYLDDLFSKIGVRLPFKLTDKELTYLLWRSCRNLEKSGALGEADNISFQKKLGLLDYGKDTVFDTESPVFREGGDAYTEYENAVPNKQTKRGEKLAYKLTEAYQDSMLSLKKLQEAIANETGKPVLDFENAYMAENRMSSMNASASEVYMRDKFVPMIDQVKLLMKDGASYEDIIKYVMSKHGLERNEYMLNRDAEAAAEEERKKFSTGLALEGYDTADPDDIEAQEALAAMMKEFKEDWVIENKRDYSGLSSLYFNGIDISVDAYERMAQEFVDDFEKDHDTEGLWSAINAATKDQVERSHSAGIIDKETRDRINGMYKYYVPLRGFDETIAEDMYSYVNAETSPYNAPIKVAKGRKSIADDPFATIGNMAESGIMQANRNEMKQHLYRLARNHRTSLLTIAKQWYVLNEETGEWEAAYPDVENAESPAEFKKALSEFEARMNVLQMEGKATKDASKVNVRYRAFKRQEQQHIITVKVNGKEYNVFVNGNPKAAQAVNGQTNPDTTTSEGIFRLGKSINNFMARNFTSRNPAFVLSNLSRDVIFSGTAVAVKENGRYNSVYHKNIMRAFSTAMLPRLVRKWNNGTLDMSDETERYFYEFVTYGGETGYTRLNTVDDYKKKIKSQLRQVNGNPVSAAENVWDGLWESIEFLNKSAEDTTRFMIYMTSRQIGRSRERAVWDAKEITVNFNKKGDGGFGAKWINLFYIFSNAAIQAMSNFVRIAKNNPGDFAIAVSTFAASGMIVPTIAAAMQAIFSDDDDDMSYWDLPEWVRRNNMVLYIPFTGNGFIIIPLPHELRPFYGFGEMLFSASQGKMKYSDIPAEAVKAFGSLLPLDFAGNGGIPSMAMVPTYALPVAQIAANRDYFGKPIRKENPYNEEMPAWSKAYRGTTGWLVDGSRWLNKITGGNDVKKGAVNIDPSWIEHLFESYLGGTGKTISQVGKTLSMLWNPEMREVRNVPVLSGFLQMREERTRNSGVVEQYFKFVKEAKETERLIREYNKRLDDPLYAAEKQALLNSPEFVRYSILQEYSKEIDALRESVKNTTDEKSRKHFEQLQYEVQNIVVDRMESTMTGNGMSERNRKAYKMSQYKDTYLRMQREETAYNKAIKSGKWTRELENAEIKRQTSPEYTIYQLYKEYESIRRQINKANFNTKQEKEEELNKLSDNYYKVLYDCENRR